MSIQTDQLRVVGGIESLGEEHLRRIIEQAAIGMIVAGPDGRGIYANARFCDMLGYTCEECMGMGIADLVHPDEDVDPAAVVDALASGRLGGYETERRWRRKDGSTLWVLVSVITLREYPNGPVTHFIIQALDIGTRKHAELRLADGTPDRVIGLNWDISQARALRRKLEYQANHDSLTGLPNRHAFERELREAVAQATDEGRRHVLCFFDLDRFKIVNDNAGHLAGDALLCKISDLLKKRSRKGDLVARIGGDEFVLLLRDCDIAVGEALAGQLVHTVNTVSFSWEGKKYDIGVSIGLTAITGDERTPDNLLSQADAACYAAKASGSGQVRVYDEAKGEARRYRRESQVVSDIHGAIDSGRLHLFAQEILDLKHMDRHTGRHTGRKKYFEILLRMRELDDTLLRPSEFVLAAERYGLMGRLDRWVLRTLLREYGARLHQAGVSVAVNLSANLLSDPESWVFLREELATTPLSPRCLHLEITETALIDNLSSAVSLIERARAAGCGITLDDFGTGQSSFAYLRQFAVDTIKIDGSFISQVADSNVDRAIIESIDAIARRLGAVTVAEHVEDSETLALVREIGIDHAQGHAIAYPVPLSDIV